MHYCLNKPGSEVGSLNFQSPVSANPTKKIEPDCLVVHLFYGERGNIF